MYFVRIDMDVNSSISMQRAESLHINLHYVIKTLFYIICLTFFDELSIEWWSCIPLQISTSKTTIVKLKFVSTSTNSGKSLPTLNLGKLDALNNDKAPRQANILFW